MADRGNVEITWLGHATFRLRTAAGKTLIIDPWLAANPACPEPLKKVDRLDGLLLTHGHFDHIGDAVALARHKVFWLRFNLPPALKTPICATGKLVHTHMESNHDTYAGMAFDFSFNPSHQKFVVDQICRYIATQQREQTMAMAANGQGQPQRRTA